jgi:WD40 repeat protein/biotin carboxyl carrier protein
MRRYPLKALMFGLLGLSVAACSESNPTANKGGELPNKVIDIGNLLFAEAAWPSYPVDVTAEPIRVPLCHLTLMNRVDVPSKEDGTIAWLGVEITDKEIADQKIDMRDIFEGGSGEVTDPHIHTTKYRRLRLGDQVKKGQIVAQLNDIRAVLDCDIAYSNIEGAKEQLKAAIDGIQYYQANLKIEEDAHTSTSAVVGAKASLAKAIAEKASKAWDVMRTEGEDKKAKDKLKNHFIRAPITGEVVQFLKLNGEGVKASDPVLQIQNTHLLGVEGNLEVQYDLKVKVGAEAFMEPAIMEPPISFRSPHTSSKPISAVAAGVRDGKQVIVSASEDGSVFVWYDNTTYANWKHSGAVRALAVTRPECEKALVLTGCDDGKARLYALNETGQAPLLTLDGHHEGGVQAAAFASDGAFCVTADDRGNIFLYDVAKGKRIYQFPREHNGAVGALSFTKQCRVISVGHDNVAHVWKVGDKSASIETSFDRSGEVANLGVSDDGGQMLLDLDKNRLRVINLDGDRNLGTFRQAGDGKFSGFALFSPVITGPNDRVILTAGGTDGVLQLWRWTSGIGRGSELKKLVCNGYTPATCAAYSPLAKDGFIVAGTRKGDVHVWPMPSAEEMSSRFKARITHIDPNLESSGRTVRIFGEYINPEEPAQRLRPGTTTTLVIPQK